MSRKYSSGPLLLVLLSSICFWEAESYSSWTPDTFPNPQTEPAKCGRSRVSKSWVCDPDKILSKNSGDVIEGTLKAIAEADEPYAEAKDCGGGRRASEGYQVGVALAKSMFKEQGADAGEAAEEFAAKLMDNWGVGDAECQDGVVLFLSQDPRQVAIYAGRGAKDALDEEQAQEIIGAMRPLLRAGKTGAAMEQAVVDIGIALAQGGRGGHSVWGIIAAVLFFALFFAVLVTSCLQGYMRRRQMKECQGLLEKLKREQAVAAATHQYPATSCPVCLEDFDVPPPDCKADAVPSAPPLSAMQEAREERLGPQTKKEHEADLRSKLLDARSDSSGRQGGASCKPLVLPCGHTLCETCLSRWLKDHNTCPVCRTELTGSQDAPPQSRPRTWDSQSVETELLFRLTSLQRLYPYIITADIVAAWTAQVRDGGSLDWPAVREEQLSRYTRDMHASSGALGASSSFGGGGSSGGTGASSSW